MQAEVNVALSDEDIARIAKAVVAELKAVGGQVNGNAPKTEEVKKPAAKPKAAEKPAEPEKAKGPSREDLVGLLNKVAEKFGGDRSKAIEAVNKYSPKFGDVTEDQFADLAKDLQALLDAPAEADSGEGW